MGAILPNDLSVRHLYDVAHRQALRIGMRYEDAEDCAQEFVLRMLCRCLHVLREKFAQANFPFWLKRCAHNHALNYSGPICQDTKRTFFKLGSAPFPGVVCAERKYISAGVQ